MTLAEKLSTYEEEYWDFSQYRSDPPLVRYPAVMVAPMQACILKEIITTDTTIKNVFDPFCGSGTVLLEGQKLGLDVMGFDINPLAALITRVQLQGIPKSKIVSSIDALNMRITLLVGNVKPYEFTNIEKWFNHDVILSLSVIRKAILEENDDSIRRFYWCCFAETVKHFSNTRTSTFKLHIKEQKDIDSLVDDSIAFFKSHIQVNFKRLEKNNICPKGIDIRCGDSKNLLTLLPQKSVDLICTSPPYGDNHTTVTYGQFSVLPLLWIDSNDLMLWDEDLLHRFTAIDSASLGGTIKRKNQSTDQNQYSGYCTDISAEKQKKIKAFFDDYETVFELLAGILKPGKLLVMTLGNRRVDNKEIPFDKFNDELAAKYGLKLDSTITRRIIGKRMPCKVSNIKDCGSVQSMSKEYVKIYRKER